MTDWINRAIGITTLDSRARARLAALRPLTLPQGKVLFRPGDPVSGFVLVLAGQVGVYLTGPTGREIRLYSVAPGETCVQTTLGLLGEQDYAGEAVSESTVELVLVPKALFMDLLATSSTFRGFVFRAFAQRLQTVMQVLEQVAFIKVEARLASVLLKRAGDGDRVHATHQDLATAIGSAREVVSRRLERFGKQGLVALDRGEIRITDRAGLTRLAAPAGAT